MPLVQTQDLKKDEVRPDNEQVYNGLDCMLTFEIFEELQTLFNRPPEMYFFERALQGPALEMMLRGFKIDELERRRGIDRIEKELATYQEILNEFAHAVWSKPLNANSPAQCKEFFYSSMHIPEVWISKQGQRRLSVDREALEKIDVYLHARPIVACILAIRERKKLLSVLQTEVDPDGRMRTSYNIAGTETWRWSSSASSFGTGTNLQNITAELRRMFISDRGKRLFGIDLEQAESREVGFLCGSLFGDWSYLDACEGGDLHTTTARLIWPQELPWQEDPKRNRELAEQPFYRHFSYRDMSKRGGHGSNYLGTPFTMARHLKVPTALMENFQQSYFSAFPGIPKWHQRVAQELQTTQTINTVYDVSRVFFGRPNDDATLREAIAFGPQFSTAFRMNRGIYNIWKEMGKEVDILAQVHDAVYFQADEDKDPQRLAKRALELISCEIKDKRTGRVFDVPGEVKTGFNWASEDKKLFSDGNPLGLRKLKRPDLRTR